MHRTEGGITASDAVGLVVEYAPATGETRVRFPDGVRRPDIFCFVSQHFTTNQVVLEKQEFFYVTLLREGSRLLCSLIQGVAMNIFITFCLHTHQNQLQVDKQQHST
jgi:hypothetical protein